MNWLTRNRVPKTIKFIGDLPAGGTVLCMGGNSLFDDVIVNHFKLEKFVTVGDLDFGVKANGRIDRLDAVFCFEVIEHLMNPLFAMNSLREYCDKNTKVFLSYPIRQHLFWWEGHFHEMDRDRFLTVIESAGFEVVRYERHIVWDHPLFYLSGIRPFLRLTIGRRRGQFYELRVK